MIWFKKKLSSREINNLYLNLSLIGSWTKEYRRKILTQEEKFYIVEKIGKLAGTPPSKEEILSVILMELTNPDGFDEILKMTREEHNYDDSFELLCKNAAIDEIYYTKIV
jgi:hypothetical protein